MAKWAVLVLVSFGACPMIGRAQEAREAASVVFWPQPLTRAALPIDPAGVGRVTQASRSSGAGTAAGAEPAAAERTELKNAVDARLEAIDRLQATDGERSPALMAELTALAALYQELGEWGSAAGALEDAIRIARINFGLYSLNQIEAVESLVVVKRANGEHAQVAERREYLRDLVRRNADDARVVGVLNNLAVAEMQAARELIDVQAPFAIVANPGEAQIPLPPQKPAAQALQAARSDYIAALQAALRTRTGNARDWWAMENALADTVYFEYAHPELYGLNYPSMMAEGPAAWRRQSIRAATSGAGTQILANRVRDGLNFGLGPVELAHAWLELADWHLVHSEFVTALTEYDAAHDVLATHNVARETIDEILSPEIPPIIPRLPAGPTGAPRDRARGYIDASVEVSRFGVVKRVSIVAVSPGTSRQMQRAFRAWVGSTRFRPRFVNDELARTDRFGARFYFD